MVVVIRRLNARRAFFSENESVIFNAKINEERAELQI